MTNAYHRFDNAKRRRAGDHDRQRMLTPPYILEPIRMILGGIGLDPCTEVDNPTKADFFYALPEDGLKLPWHCWHSVFCNPPYGEVRNEWVERCVQSGRKRPTVLLVPAHTETQISQRALRACESVLFVKARIRYGVVRDNGRQEAASHGSMLLSFGVHLAPLAHLGTVFGESKGVRDVMHRIKEGKE